MSYSENQLIGIIEIQMLSGLSKEKIREILLSEDYPEVNKIGSTLVTTYGHWVQYTNTLNFTEDER